MIVVSNTSPICYLVLIDEIDVLPRLYGQVIIPEAVRDELRASGSPAVLQNWIAHPPDWLEIQSVVMSPDEVLEALDFGEREAILLAERLEADLIILDERAARRVAAERGLKVVGLLGILAQSAKRKLIDLPAAIERLRQTRFRASSSLLQSLLDRHRDEA